MNRLRWQFMMFKRQLGWAGVLGLAGMFFFAAYFFTMVVPGQKSLNQARQVLLIAKREQLTNTAKPTIVTQSPTQQLTSFILNFPNETSINATWERLSKLVEKSGLNIDRSVYESSPEKHAGLLRYHLKLPLKATYPQLRNFLAEVIQTNPNLALESINFKRESVDSSMVDASIGLVVYMRAQ